MAIEGLTSHYYDNKVPYHVATEEEVEVIINATFDLLENMGMEMSHPEACKILVDAGCTYENGKMKVPRELIIDAINKAPSHVLAYDREGNLAMDLGGTNVYWGTAPTNPFINDFETGERRPVVCQDNADAAKVSDACPNIDYLMNMGDPNDCPPDVCDVFSTREILFNTTKPFVPVPKTAETFAAQCEMAAAVAGGWDKFLEKPFMFPIPGNAIPPLTFLDEPAWDKIIWAVKHGVTCVYTCVIQLGLSGPIDIPSSMVVMLTENFIEIVLAQTLNPGVGFIGGPILNSVNMSSISSCYGTPEHCLGETLIADIYHYLDLPFMGTANASASKIMDEQYAIECAFTTFTDVLNGGHLVHNGGMIDNGLSTDIATTVMIDVIVSYAKRIARSFEISRDKIKFDVINQVGHGGSYLVALDTAVNCRDIWTSDLFDFGTYGNWCSAGSKDMRTRIREKTANILATHEAKPLPEEVVDKINAIVDEVTRNVVDEA